MNLSLSKRNSKITCRRIIYFLTPKLFPHHIKPSWNLHGSWCILSAWELLTFTLNIKFIYSTYYIMSLRNFCNLLSSNINLFICSSIHSFVYSLIQFKLTLRDKFVGNKAKGRISRRR